MNLFAQLFGGDGLFHPLLRLFAATRPKQRDETRKQDDQNNGNEWQARPATA
ncbi:hypothetical protein TomMM35A_13750 [Sphingobium sp. TomMM35A]